MGAAVEDGTGVVSHHDDAEALIKVVCDHAPRLVQFGCHSGGDDFEKFLRRVTPSAVRVAND